MPPIHSQPIVDLTSDANTIQNRFVGDSSATGYLHKLVRMALWLFDNSIDIFTTSALTSVREAHAKDQAKTNPQKRTFLRKKLKELFSQTEHNNEWDQHMSYQASWGGCIVVGQCSNVHGDSKENRKGKQKIGKQVQEGWWWKYYCK